MKLLIGKIIRKLRRDANMTQQVFAEKLGVSYQSVSRWENEETYPDMELLPAIAEIFGVTTDELIKGERIARDESAERPSPDDNAKRSASGADQRIKLAVKREQKKFNSLCTSPFSST